LVGTVKQGLNRLQIQIQMKSNSIQTAQTLTDPKSNSLSSKNLK
jgi:hypothetical protein